MPKAIPYLKCFAELETKLFQSINHTLSVAQVQTHKYRLLLEIRRSVNALLKTQDVTYRDFISLFNAVKKYKILNIHENAWLDNLFCWHYTTSLQIGLGHVRHAAFDVLENYIQTNHDRQNRYVLDSEIQTALEFELFKIPLNNWAFFEPTCYSRLSLWKNYLSDAAYDTIVLSP